MKEREKAARERTRRAIALHSWRSEHYTKMYNAMADVFNLGVSLDKGVSNLLGESQGSAHTSEQQEIFWTDAVLPFLEEFYDIMPRLIELFDEDDEIEQAFAKMQEDSERRYLEKSFGEGGIN